MTQAETIERIVGRAIVKVRYMTVKEANDMMWDHVAPVLVLDDGTQLFPSMDSEGNGAGALFGRTADVGRTADERDMALHPMCH